MYCTVVFKEDNTVEVVPKNWLIPQSGQKYLCMWPPNNDSNMLLQMVKEAANPEGSWTIYDSELIHTSST